MFLTFNFVSLTMTLFSMSEVRSGRVEEMDCLTLCRTVSVEEDVRILYRLHRRFSIMVFFFYFHLRDCVYVCMCVCLIEIRSLILGLGDPMDIETNILFLEIHTRIYYIPVL